MQRMGRERLPKAMLWGEMDGGVTRQVRPKKTWWDGVKDDLKELRLVLHWRKLCQNREKWGKVDQASRRKEDEGGVAIPRFESFGQTKGEEWSGCPGGSGGWHQGASQAGCFGGGYH